MNERPSMPNISVGGLLKVLAWITLIGGIAGGFMVALAMSSGGRDFYGNMKIDALQFWTFWLGVSAASVMWFGILHGLGEIVDATNKIANSLDSRNRQS